MSIDKKYPFDGLVLTSEQKDIDYDYNVNVTSKKIPCYDKETYTNKSCGSIAYDRCKGCNLPFFDGNASAFIVAMDALGGVDPFENEIVKTIFEGVNREELTYSSKANYYNIYASEYSHMYIAQCDEVIAIIIGFLA